MKRRNSHPAFPCWKAATFEPLSMLRGLKDVQLNPLQYMSSFSGKLHAALCTTHLRFSSLVNVRMSLKRHGSESHGMRSQAFLKYACLKVTFSTPKATDIWQKVEFRRGNLDCHNFQNISKMIRTSRPPCQFRNLCSILA